ncbi:unnamed protein product [Rhizoctonia solani]|uniref:Uncharacterized protein n=1 Tax=Rhizoctonia solani TaxID=456999 RepID=A0A8H3G8T2_9AGAM|nr:unnamed protein product [Rhizoctonia solani]
MGARGQGWLGDTNEDDKYEYAPQRTQRNIVLPSYTNSPLDSNKDLVAPGAQLILRGPERVEQDNEDEDEDEDDGNKNRGEVTFAKQGDVDYTSRVYDWRSERKG